MTIETRPDFCLTPHLSQMLSYGCTRLEIGLQVRGGGLGAWGLGLRAAAVSGISGACMCSPYLHSSGQWGASQRGAIAPLL